MRRILVAFLPLVLVVAGCAKPAAPFVGRWLVGEPLPRSGNPEKDVEAAKQMEQFTIDIRADKTFSFAGRTGIYEITGRTITMKVSDPKSEKDKEPATGLLSQDGKTLTLSDHSGKEPLAFGKVARLIGGN